MELIYKELTCRINKCAIDVHRELGSGFVEKVYENSLIMLLREEGLFVEKQKHIPVYFRGKNVGNFYADVVVEKKVIIELKTAKYISKEHQIQVLNYLKATGYTLGIILNFGAYQIGIKRVVNSK